jgi:RNA polymerase sigma-54 factor
MALELKQGLKLSQQLVITQALQQAIHLLQLNHQELVEEVSQEMVENPTLEEIPGTSPDEPVIPSENHSGEPSTSGGDEPEGSSEGADKVDWERFLDGYSSNAYKSGAGNGGQEELPPIEANLTALPSLADHLLWQLQMLSCTEEEGQAAQAIIHNLDHRGYLMTSLESIAEQHGVDLESVEGAQEIVQSLDPPGCGSLTLRECLLVQAHLMASEDPFLPRIIQEHLDNIEKRNYQAIARDLDIDVEDAIEYHRMIQKMEPIPGRQFADTAPQYITPDIYVFKMGGEWVIMQNEDGLPKLRVSPYYEVMLKSPRSSKRDREYIKTKLQSAAFLIQSIHKRQRTIYKVVRSILDRQQDFFEFGIDHLKPMVLRDVADDIGVHESTVSRATTNKYIHSPQGIFELKFFFNAAISRVGGEDVASEMVKNRIKQVVAKEDSHNPLSDQAIVDFLRKEGLKVARRTIAKYREEIGILPSSRRRSVF